MRRALVTLYMYVGLLMVVAAFWLGVAVLLESHRLPRCVEDVVLVGSGEFEDGRWDVYVCGPALDDLQ